MRIKVFYKVCVPTETGYLVQANVGNRTEGDKWIRKNGVDGQEYVIVAVGPGCIVQVTNVEKRTITKGDPTDG